MTTRDPQDEEERRERARAPEAAAPEVRRARARLAGGDVRGALRLAKERLEDEPGDALAWFEMSRILYEMGDRPAALDARLKALALKRASTDAAAIADMLIEDGMYGEAEALLRARLESDDSQFTTRFTLARILLVTGRYLEAADEIRRLYEHGQSAPLVRADYLEALRFALLGDLDSLSQLVTRLRSNDVADYRLRFFEELEAFVAGGDADAFADAMGRLRRATKLSPVYRSLYRAVTPDLFQGAESRSRQEFHRVLGSRLALPKISGVDLPADQQRIAQDLFSRYSAVEFREIDDPHGGFSGDRVYRVFLTRRPYVENTCLVKIGRKHRVAIEKEKMERYVSGLLHPSFHPRVEGYSYGLRSAALRLSWSAAADETPFSLRKMYLDPRFTAEEFAGAVERLMRQVLYGWHVRNTRRRPSLLFRNIAPALKDIERCVVSRFPGAGSDAAVLAAPALGTSLRNPVVAIRALLRERSAEKHSIPFGLHHGDLNARNVLLDSLDTVCLVDFYKSGPGFVLKDYARLEADLRFETLDASSGPAEELRWMDERLARSMTREEIRSIDVRASMLRRRDVAAVLRPLAAEILGVPPDELRVLYAVALIDVLSRLLRYDHLAPVVTELVLAEIADLAAGLGAGGSV